MDIQDLSIFVRVAALQNLSAVGNEKGLTPGTISKRIQALENELQVRLFDRTTRSIRITDEGERFLLHAKRILEEFELGCGAIRTHTGTPAGRLKIAAPELLGRVLVCSAVNAFIASFPDISVQLDLTDRPVNLHEEGYDIAIHLGELGDSSLIAKKLMSDRRVFAAAPGYIERFGMPQVPSDLLNHRCLALCDTHIWSFARSADEEESVRLPVILRSTNSEVLRVAAIQGAGIIQSSELQLAPELARGDLLPVLVDGIEPQEVAIHALYLSGKQTLPRLRMFLDHLSEQFRSDRASPPETRRAKPAAVPQTNLCN